MAAGRAPALVLVVNVGRCFERLLETMSAEQRARPVQPICVAHFLGDLDLAILAHDLLDQLHREEWREVGGSDRLSGTRGKDRGGPGGGNRGGGVTGARGPRFIRPRIWLPGGRGGPLGLPVRPLGGGEA